MEKSNVGSVEPRLVDPVDLEGVDKDVVDCELSSMT